jgi:hypothetical protein
VEWTLWVLRERERERENTLGGVCVQLWHCLEENNQGQVPRSGAEQVLHTCVRDLGTGHQG